MKNLNEHKDLLLKGAELELCGDKDSAKIIYKAYIQEAARVTDGVDALEVLYGPYIYSDEVASYSDAISWATIAICAQKLVVLMRSKFPGENCWADGRTYIAQQTVVDFFKWLEKSRTSIEYARDFEVLEHAYNTMRDSDRVGIELSASGYSCNLMTAIDDVLNNRLCVKDRKLRL